MNNSENIPSIHEAVDNLAVLSDLDLNHPSSMGMTYGLKFVTEDEVLPDTEVQWFSPENIEDIVKTLKKTYISVLEYLKKINEDKGFGWEKKKIRQGIQEMMELAGKATDQVDSYIDSIKDIVKLDKLKISLEYQNLLYFYLEKIQKNFEVPLEGKEDWDQNWQAGENATLLDIDKSGLKDFNTVKNDLEYELFYLKNSDGHPFFQKELLKNIELYCDFDQSKQIQENDPLLRIASFIDRNQLGISNQILHKIFPALTEFYQCAKAEDDKRIYFYVNQMIMSLMLASNPKNLMQNTFGKNTTQYFYDFQIFLNQLLTSKIFKESVSKKNHFSRLALEVTYYVCQVLFMNKGAIKEEMIGFIHRLISLGEELDNQEKCQKDDSIWVQILKNDENLRKTLNHFPSGPIFKILDVIREKVSGFYPLMQGNLPKQLYSFTYLKNKVDVLKIPSPTKQVVISKAEIADEFLGFLRSYSFNNQTKKHLLINLQDRTSWKEHARTKQIEDLDKNQEFKGHYFIVTLTKDTDFYHQNEHYLKIDKAEDFISVFKEQLVSPEEFGFYYHRIVDTDDFHSFTAKAIDMIHTLIFENKKVLSRKERQDFIEIFYHLAILKILDIINPDSISFTCKDALDVGGSFSFSFFAFLNILQNKTLKKEDKDFILYLLYTEPLISRERSINSQRLNRSLSCIDYLQKMVQKDFDDKIAVFATLFSPSFLKSIHIDY